MKKIFYIALLIALAFSFASAQRHPIPRREGGTGPWRLTDTGKVLVLTDTINGPSWQPASGGGGVPVPLVLRQDTAGFSNYALLLDNQVGTWFPSIHFRALSTNGALCESYTEMNNVNPDQFYWEQDRNGNFVSNWGFNSDSAAGTLSFVMGTRTGQFRLNFLGAGWDLTLPPSHGTAGQVLTDDGTGITSWTTPSSGSPWMATNAGSPPNPQPTALGTEGISMGSGGKATGNFSFAVGSSNFPGQALSINTLSLMGFDFATSQTNDGQHGLNTIVGGGAQDINVNDALCTIIGAQAQGRGQGTTIVGANASANGASANYCGFFGYGAANVVPTDGAYQLILTGGYGTVASPGNGIPNMKHDSTTAIAGVNLTSGNKGEYLAGRNNDTTGSSVNHVILQIGNGGWDGHSAKSNALTLFTSGNLTLGGTITATNFFPIAHYSQFAPSNPTGTASATAVMMGLGSTVTFTPTQTGTLDIDFDGAVGTNQSSAGRGVNIQIAYGTGAAPANGDAATGTTAGVIFPYVNPAGTTVAVGFRRHARITGLTLNTAYWIDLQVAAVVAGTGSVSGIEAIITEIH